MSSSYLDSLTLSALNEAEYGSVPFIGKGKSFKTGTMYAYIGLCPNLFKRRKAFFDFPDISIFPKSYGAYNVSSFDEIEVGSIAIFEDANRLFASRDSKGKNNMALQKFMGVISHKSILAMFTIQNTSNIDQCIFRDQEVINIHKMSDSIGLSYERDEFKDHCRHANVVIPRYAKQENVSWHHVSYIPKYSEVLIVSPAPGYGEKFSHSLKNVKILAGGS